MSIVSKHPFPVIGGVSSNQYVLGWQASDQCIDNTIEYCAPFSTTFTTAEILRQFAIPENGTLKSFLVYVELSSGETNGIPYTVRIDGVDTALTVTQTLNTTGIYEVVADVPVTKNEKMSFQCDNTGNFGGTRTGSIAVLFERAS